LVQGRPENDKTRSVERVERHRYRDSNPGFRTENPFAVVWSSRLGSGIRCKLRDSGIGTVGRRPVYSGDSGYVR
jgi:hypothetical protein